MLEGQLYNIKKLCGCWVVNCEGMHTVNTSNRKQGWVDNQEITLDILTFYIEKQKVKQNKKLYKPDKTYIKTKLNIHYLMNNM